MKTKKKVLRDSCGQGVTEYAAIIAFVALIIVIAFSTVGGGFSSAVKYSFTSVSNRLAATAAVAK